MELARLRAENARLAMHNDILKKAACAWLRGGTPNRQCLTDNQAIALIKSLHAEVKGAYGSMRIYRTLCEHKLRIGHPRVEQLMRLHGIHARHKRRFKVTTDSAHTQPIAKNLLARQFKPSPPIASGRVTSPLSPLGKAGSLLTCLTGKYWAGR